MEDIRKYIHYYIGKWVELKIQSPSMTRDGFEDGDYLLSGEIYHRYMMHDCALILKARKLDSMTEEEENECSKLYFDFRETQKPGTCDIFMMAAMTNWYISRGFWLWDESYFDKGIIIEDKKIKP